MPPRQLDTLCTLSDQDPDQPRLRRRSGANVDPSPRAGLITRVFLVLLVVWGGVLIAIRTAYPGLEIGDGLNDADILHASNWFAQHGYRQTAFLPVRETAFHPDFWPPTYNTFPPGAFYIHEAQRLLGLSALWQFRVVSVGLSMLAVWLWFVTARRLTTGTLIAAVAAGLYMLSRPVLSYAPGLWEHMPMLSLFATLAAWLKYESAGTPRARAICLALAAGAMFLDSWLTLQHSFMLASIIGVRTLLRWWWGRTPGSHGSGSRTLRSLVGQLSAAAAVCVMPAVVAAIRFWQQYILAGSLKNALAYFEDPFHYRAGDGRFSLSRWEVITFWLHRLGLPERFDRPLHMPEVTLYPGVTCVSLVCVGVLTLVLARRWNVPEFRPFRLALLSGLLLMGGAFTWPLVMKQHAYMHAFPVIMYLPGLTLILAGATVWGLSRARLSGQVPAAMLAALAIAPLVAPLRDMRHSDTLNRVFTLDRAEHARVRAVAEKLDVLRKASAFLAPERVLRVVPRWPSVPYMLDRPFYQYARPLDARWIADETVVVDLANPTTARIAGALALSAGFPDIIREPGAQALFPPRISSADPLTRSRCLSEEFVPGARVVEARLARTIEGERAYAGVVIDGLVHPREAARSGVLVEALGRDSRVIFSRAFSLADVRTRSAGGPLGWKQRSSDPAMLVICEMPREALAIDLDVRLTLYSPSTTLVIDLGATAPSFAPTKVPTVPAP